MNFYNIRKRFLDISQSEESLIDCKQKILQMVIEVTSCCQSCRLLRPIAFEFHSEFWIAKTVVIDKMHDMKNNENTASILIFSKIHILIQKPGR